ncbi:FkbM family methyltransferase [Methylocystis sp. FS]|uniref:FkbM family methyltransferase n=1 Tax=Methylocystis silviterrae TaxID=2743612 RepID=UPI00158175ED|nr:FkbM family methyltransferase [Methylocystis silviterrae]
MRWAPGIGPLARKVYGHLPESWHDTPTSRLRAFYADREEVTFLQIGAYDGIAGDPLRPIVVADERWRGILVEPQPWAFERLKSNYREASHRLFFVNCAISSTGGKTEFYYVSPETIERDGLPAYYAELASFDRDNIVKHAPSVFIETIVIETLTVADALTAAGCELVDCLVLDIEGLEATVLGNIDFNLLGVSFVVFEHKHLTAVDMASVMNRLASFGFRTKAFGRDTIAWRAAEDLRRS